MPLNIHIRRKGVIAGILLTLILLLGGSVYNNASAQASGSCQNVSNTLLLKAGSRGPAVSNLQQCLIATGSAAVKVDGVYGTNTQHAVIAKQKEAGFTGRDRDGVVGPKTARILQAAKPLAAFPATSGSVSCTTKDVACVDLTRQIIYFRYHGGIYVADTSTGNGATYVNAQTGKPDKAITRTGHATIYRQYNGPAEPSVSIEGAHLYYGSYLQYGSSKSGIAIHGYSSVPTDAASHGCIRTTFAVDDMLFTVLKPGSQVTITS